MHAVHSAWRENFFISGLGPVSRRQSALSQNAIKLTYNPALDGMRAVAILMVILSHAHAPMFDGAFFGVDLFFVLSGYLITSLLLKEMHANEGRIDFWQFFRRRFYRLMPPLLLFLGAYCLIAPWVWPELDDIYSDSLVSALYLADYGIAFFDMPDTLLHMWSLSVEEHFYLIWPFVLWWIASRTTADKLWRYIGLLFLVGWAWRVFWVAMGQEFYEVFFRFDTRTTGLLLGSMLSALVISQHSVLGRLQNQLPRLMWLPLAVPWLMMLEWGDMEAMVWGLTLVEFASFAILLSVLPGKGLIFDMLSSPALVKIGQLSYGIYLWHYPIVRWLRAEFAWPVAVVLGFALSTLMAAISYRTIERWAMKRRDAKPSPHQQKPTATSSS